MSKCTLEYTLPEDQDDLDAALNGARYKHALWDVSQEVFRPARKHGYSDPRIQQLLEMLNEMVQDRQAAGEEGVKGYKPLPTDWPRDEFGPLDATDLIAMLERLFFNTLDNTGVGIE